MLRAILKVIMIPIAGVTASDSDSDGDSESEIAKGGYMMKSRSMYIYISGAY